jgi:GT2 family glycosyltransferase
LIDQLSLLLKVPHLFPKVLDKYLMKDFNPEIEQEVETVRGAFMLVRKSILDKIGFAFDLRYFIWFEDIDLCREIKNMGLKVVYTPMVSCVDMVGQSFKQRANLWKQKNFTASMLKYFKKWEPIHIWIWIAIFRPLAIFMVWLKEKAGKNNSDKIRASL